MHFSCDSSRDLVNKRLHLKPYIIIWSPDEYKKINIPEDYGHLYMNVPLDFTQYRVDEKTYIIFTSFWNKISWKDEGYEE